MILNSVKLTIPRIPMISFITRFVLWFVALALTIQFWRWITSKNAESPSWPNAYILRYLILLRVPLIFGLFLIIFPLLATLTPLSKFLGNLFVLSQPWQIGVVVLGAAISALSCTIAAEIISENVGTRFHIPSPFLLLTSEKALLHEDSEG